MTPEQRQYVIASLSRYWGPQQSIIGQLPIKQHGLPEIIHLPAMGIIVLLPSWANSISVEGGLIIPLWANEQAEGRWDRVDWLAVCFWYLNNMAERHHEALYGPIHSYSTRLKGWDERLWQHAWVNRIALFLRKWASFHLSKDEVNLFGPLPDAEIVLTHDVDAVSKTIAIRLKQTAFHSFNAVKFLLNGKLAEFIKKSKKAFQFFFSQDNYWCFDQIMNLEERCSVRSIFNCYAGRYDKKRSMKEMLFDPSYDVHDFRLKDQIKKMHGDGWTIGLHQSFDAWEDEKKMAQEKKNLEMALGATVTTCRQHWLRFSYSDTWKIQERIGFLQDTTLGFNDRPSFRNSAALAFQPWSSDTGTPMNIESLPLVLMDSHVYDYHPYNNEDRNNEIRKWLDEIIAVKGHATIVWHQRVMSKDYDWADSYTDLVEEYFLEEV